MSEILVLPPHPVRLGPGDAPQVNRLLPQRAVRRVGAWCLMDEFGPTADGVRLPPHPHAGLQTITWLFEGRMRWRDSLGTDAVLRPGEVLSVTAGRGVTHTGASDAGDELHGVELWAVLPADARGAEPRVEHVGLEPVRIGDHEVAILVGVLGWEDSPVETASPLLAAEVRLASDEPLEIDADPGWEYGVLAVSDGLEVDGVAVPRASWGHSSPGAERLTIRGHASAGHVVTAFVVGGRPVSDDVVVFWNFAASGHDELGALRDEWQATMDAGSVGVSGRFGRLAEADEGHAVACPPLPSVRLTPGHHAP